MPRPVAQEYRSGRAFLAGDAAHTHPPYGWRSSRRPSPRSPGGSHSFEARAGHHLSPQVLTSGRNVLDAPESSVSPVEGAAAALGVPLTVLRDSVADGRAQCGSHRVLARPDQHVAWAGDDAPPDVDGLIRMVTGRP